MRISALSIEGAWRVEPELHDDERGTFLEWYKADALAEVVGHTLTVLQSNLSTSAAGTLRGIHFAQVPPGQAKYVTCITGAVLDAVVDLRPGSPTFGRHELVHLDQEDRHALYLSEGLGHGYLALTDGACSCTSARPLTRQSGSTAFTRWTQRWASPGRTAAPTAARSRGGCRPGTMLHRTSPSSRRAEPSVPTSRPSRSGARGHVS